MDADRRTWDERYADQLAPPPLPPVGLPEVADAMPAGGRALDLACGLGSTAVWAARRGFDTVGVDVSPVAIEGARRLAEQLGVAQRVCFVVHDLDGGLPPPVRGPFDLVVCQRFRQPALYPTMAQLLAPGGLVVVTVLSQVGAGKRPGPYHAPEGELLRAFRRFGQVLFAREGGGEATVVVRRAVDDPPPVR